MAGTLKEEAVRLRLNMDEVYKAGQKSEYDQFWDAYQENGNRTQYVCGFGGYGWTNDNLKPKYDVICEGSCNAMFQYCGFVGDLAQHFEELGIVLDFSGITSAHSLFNSALTISRVGVVDITNCGAATSSIFASYKGHTIDKFVVNENNTFVSVFQSATYLQNIVIEGTIAKSFDIKWSPLSVASMKSIISALKNFTGTGSENSQTIKFSDNCWAALEADSTAPDGGTWQDYVFAVLCWNI